MRKALGEREARTLRGNWNALLHHPLGGVSIKTPPFSILGRSKGQPREKKEDISLRKFSLVLPFLSRGPGPWISSFNIPSLLLHLAGSVRV